MNLTGDFTCEQFKADEVYEKFITDLEGAIALNALPMHWDDANIGRVNKAMAYMLFTEAVMYQLWPDFPGDRRMEQRIHLRNQLQGQRRPALLELGAWRRWYRSSPYDLPERMVW